MVKFTATDVRLAPAGKVTGNVLDIEVTETYHEILYPLSQFETFKKVINAAADFNKVVLVLEKKG